METSRVRLEVAYDGGDFFGWAVQPHQRTVAGVLTEALLRLFSGTGTVLGGNGDGSLAGGGVAFGMTVAGRTDAGVHATGQVCHLDLPADAWARLRPTLLRRLAALLPPDVRVRGIAEAPAGFDARFSALYRRYSYRVTDAVYGADPLCRHNTLAWPRPLDQAALNAAAEGLIGEHDFAAFCRRKKHGTTVRAISHLEWVRDPDGVLVAGVQADAFCQAMVRSLVGAMLAVGDGRRSPEWPAAQLNRRERSGEVTVAPARGLTLVEIGYPADPAELAARAEATRRLRALDSAPDRADPHRADSTGGCGAALL